MFQLSLFEFTSPATAPAVFVDMPAVSDPSFPTNINRHLVPPGPWQVLLAHAFGQTDLTNIQLQTPKLRPISLPQIRPLDVATLPQTRPPLDNFKRQPIMLDSEEEVSMQVSASIGTINNNYFAALWLSDGGRGVSQGQVWPTRFTSTITCVNGQWTAGNIVLQQTLPKGVYAVVGMDVFGTNLAYARLIFVDQQRRPGILCGQNAAFINAPCFRNGELGDYGKFNIYTQPQLDCFAIGACTAQEGVLDLVRISS